MSIKPMIIKYSEGMYQVNNHPLGIQTWSGKSTVISLDLFSKGVRQHQGAKVLQRLGAKGKVKCKHHKVEANIIANVFNY